MADLVWKKTQLDVIDEKEGEILVSASAGSGKTTVMIERLIRLIEDGTSVDEVLCLTFTESAAEEIKDRLKKALVKRLNSADDNMRARYVRQLDRLAYADISTIDAFCKRIVSRYFEKAGVDPSFSIASDDESKNIKYRTAEKVLSVYGEQNEPTYMELLDFFGKKRSEESLFDTIISIDGYLSSIAGRDSFVQNLIDQTEVSLLENFLFRAELDKADKVMREITTLCREVWEYGFTYVQEVYEFINRLFEAKDISVQEFFKVAKSGVFEKPHYGRKPYCKYKETQSTVIKLRNLVDEFVEKFTAYEYETVEFDLEKTSIYAKKLLEIVSVFREQYEKAMERVNLLDFSMIEDKASLCLRDDDVRRDIVDRFTHVLVDEYQDTNKLQDEIILLCSGGKSLFMVGDAKQSIYEFRHAEPSLFLEKRNKDGIKAHQLFENFRTDEKIIQGINRIFNAVYAEDVTGESYQGQEMIPQNQGLDDVKPLSLRVFFAQKREEKTTDLPLYSVENTEKSAESEEEKEETIYVYSKIKSLIASGFISDGAGGKRKIEPKDIAVLYRSRSDMVNSIVDKLRKDGVPLSLTEKTSLPYSAELLIHLFKAVDNIAREDSLVCCMLSPLFEFSENELATYKTEGKQKGFLNSLLAVRGKYSKLDDFFSKLEDYKFRSKHTDVASLADFIIKDLDLERKIASIEDGSAELKELENYLASLRGSKIAGSLSDYLNYFDKYPEFTSSRVSGSADGVRFMTVHASKGLEFPVIFLVGCGKLFNRSDARERVLLHKKYGVAIPSFDTITRKYRSNFFLDSVKDKMKVDCVAQELRLLYVAMTRAKNLLLLSGTSQAQKEDKFKEKEDVKKANSFLDLLLTARNKDSQFENYVDYGCGLENATSVEIAEQKEEIDNGIDISKYKNILDFEYAYKKATVTPSKFTVTGVVSDSEDDEPRVTLTKSESAEVGTLYHTVMQNIDFCIENKENVKKALDKMLLDNIISIKERESVDEELIVKVLNLPIIKSVANKKQLKEQEFLLRAPLSDLIDGEIDDEVLLQGVIDLLILDDIPIIIDYKYSGANADILRARYKKQLDLYGLAVKKILNTQKVKKYLLSLKTGEVIEFED